MRRISAWALAFVLGCSTWLGAADAEKKEPAGKQAPASSVELFHQMQTQLKKQQAEIEKLQAQLQQSREALLKAHRKIPEGAPQAKSASPQTALPHEKANSLNDKVMDMSTAGNVRRSRRQVSGASTGVAVQYGS